MKDTGQSPVIPLFYGTSLRTLLYEIWSETVIIGILKLNKVNLKHIFQVYLGLHKKETVVQEHARVTQTCAK